MKRLCSLPLAGWLAVIVLAGLAAPALSAPEGLVVQAQLIWGTNDPQSPDPKHRDIGPELSAKLKASAFRWKNYFEVKRHVASIPTNETKTLIMSDLCKVEIKSLGGDMVEIKLFGEGKPLATRKEKLAVDWPLIMAGDAKNDTAWMVVIRKAAPNAKLETVRAN